VFGGFFGGAGGDDGVGVKGGGGGIGREEGAANGEVDGGGMFGGEGGEDEVDFGAGGEGGVEVGGGRGVEASLEAEVVGDEAGEVVVAAVAKRAGAAGDLVVAVAVSRVEAMVGGDGFGDCDGGAFWAAAEGGGRGD
jgi:hypothetical protein